jgi:hypothetical protein
MLDLAEDAPNYYQIDGRQLFCEVYCISYGSRNKAYAEGSNDRRGMDLSFWNPAYCVYVCVCV